MMTPLDAVQEESITDGLKRLRSMQEKIRRLQDQYTEQTQPQNTMIMTSMATSTPKVEVIKPDNSNDGANQRSSKANVSQQAEEEPNDDNSRKLFSSSSSFDAQRYRQLQESTSSNHKRRNSFAGPADTDSVSSFDAKRYRQLQAMTRSHHHQDDSDSVSTAQVQRLAGLPLLHKVGSKQALQGLGELAKKDLPKGTVEPFTLKIPQRPSPSSVTELRMKPASEDKTGMHIMDHTSMQAERNDGGDGDDDSTITMDSHQHLPGVGALVVSKLEQLFSNLTAYVPDQRKGKKTRPKDRRIHYSSEISWLNVCICLLLLIIYGKIQKLETQSRPMVVFILNGGGSRDYRPSQQDFSVSSTPIREMVRDCSEECRQQYLCQEPSVSSSPSREISMHGSEESCIQDYPSHEKPSEQSSSPNREISLHGSEECSSPDCSSHEDPSEQSSNPNGDALRSGTNSVSALTEVSAADKQESLNKSLCSQNL